MMLMQTPRIPFVLVATQPLGAQERIKNDRIYGNTLKDSYPPAAGAAEVPKSVAMMY